MTTKSKSKSKLKEETALKLVNKYAENYYDLSKEKKRLLNDINDLKTTLIINKEIIQGFITNSSTNNKSNIIIKKQNEEINLLSLKLNETVDELNKQRDIILLIKNTSLKNQSELEAANRHIFILDNIIKEKENIIQAYTSSHKKHYNTNIKTVPIDNKSPSLKALSPLKIKQEIIYVSSPSVIINQLNSEMLYLREENQSLSKSSLLLKERLRTKDNKIKSLESKLRDKQRELDNHTEKLDKEQRANTTSQMPIALSHPNQSDHNISQQNTLGNGSSILLQQIEENSAINLLRIKSISSEDEWRQTLRVNGVTQEEYERMLTLPLHKKACGIIEMFYKLINDKNDYLKVILQENEALTQNNFRLNKINMEQSAKKSTSFITNHLKGNIRNSSSLGYLSTYCHGCSLKLGDVNNTMALNHTKTDESEMDYDSMEKNKTAIHEVHIDELSMTSSINSSDFRIGMTLDQFDLISEISTTRYRYHTKE